MNDSREQVTMKDSHEHVTEERERKTQLKTVTIKITKQSNMNYGIFILFSLPKL